MKLSRLKKVSSKDKDFNLNKAISEFKKERNVKDKDLKNKNQSNPLYREWTDFMWENYPIWSMSSVAYIMRGWSYLVGGYPYGGGYYTLNNEPQENGDFSGGDGGE